MNSLILKENNHCCCPKQNKTRNKHKWRGERLQQWNVEHGRNCHTTKRLLVSESGWSVLFSNDHTTAARSAQLQSPIRRATFFMKLEKYPKAHTKEAGNATCACNISTGQVGAGGLGGQGQTRLKQNKPSLCGNTKGQVESEQSWAKGVMLGSLQHLNSKYTIEAGRGTCL